MHKSNAPHGYICPICLGIQGSGSLDTLIKPTDIVYRDELVTGLVNSFFIDKNAGHAIVVPNAHFETIYTLPPAYGHRIFEAAQKIAVAIKTAYKCDGVTLRQNNEPAGDQHAFHFHLHVVPRYINDGYNAVRPSDIYLAEPAKRRLFAQKIRAVLDT